MAGTDPLAHLIDAAREGDEVALTRLVRATQPVVWKVCTALGSDGQVEDLVQEVYLRAIASLETFRGEGGVQAWLLVIARRVCADDVRRRARGRRLIDRVSANTRQEPTAAQDVPIHDMLKGLGPCRPILPTGGRRAPAPRRRS